MNSLDEFGLIHTALNAKINALVTTLNSEQKDAYLLQIEMTKKKIVDHFLSRPEVDQNRLLSLVEQYFSSPGSK